MSKVSWRFRKALGHPLTVGLVIAAMNFLAIVFFHPNTYIMGLATLAIFGCGAFTIEHGWMSAFVEGETTAESQGLRRVLDFVVIGTIVLLMIFG
ncbi:hypothetical protein HQ524_00590, partial [Candidatus Uhrbacteria bacterium]|nr:hypothetical protein [Candidatus Uhrbacteria bacterium]